MRKVLFVIPIVIMFVFISSSSSLASTRDMAADFLIDKALESLEKGNRDMAIHDLSKVLIFQPDNIKAQDELRKLGLDKGLFSPPKTNLSQVSQLVGEMKKQKEYSFELEVENEKVKRYAQDLEDESKYLYHDNLSKSIEIDSLSKQMEDINSAMIDRSNEQKQKLRELEQYHAEQKMVLLSELAQKQDQLNTETLTQRERDMLVDEYRQVASRNVKQARYFQDEFHQTKNDYSKVVSESNQIKSNYFETLYGIDEILLTDDQKINDLRTDVAKYNIEKIRKSDFSQEYLNEFYNSIEKINTYKFELTESLKSIEQSNQKTDKYVAALKEAQESLGKLEEHIEILLKQKNKVLN